MALEDTRHRAAPAAAEGAPRGGRDDFTPRLRILNKQSWRGSFRLEQVFWSILEEAAADRGQRLNAYVHDLLADIPEDANKSSLLRAHAAAWQRVRTRRALIEAPPALAHAVAACPLACFVMARDKRIRLFNSRFLEFLSGPGGDPAALAGSSPRMSFQSPLPDLVTRLRAGKRKVAESGLTAVVGGRVVEGRARLCLVADDGAGNWQIMAFLPGS